MMKNREIKANLQKKRRKQKTVEMQNIFMHVL